MFVLLFCPLSLILVVQATAMVEYSIRWTHMEITKDELRILRYIYSKRTISFEKLKEHFQKYSNISEIIRNMLSDGYITIASGLDRPLLWNTLPDSCILIMSGKGAVVVESQKWFNWEFIVKELVFPIIVSVIVSVITTLITLFLTGANLPPCQ